ncbi:MAG: hypothetical protein WBL63_25375 [Candidatus Acidiferrum sp.]
MEATKSEPFHALIAMPGFCLTSRGLLCSAKLHYNPSVRSFSRCFYYTVLGLTLPLLCLGHCLAQQAPAAAGARMLILPRKLVTGERATLAVLDFNGRLTPGVKITFSDGETVTTDATGRALFVAPLNPGTINASIAGRSGQVSSTILATVNLPSALEVVTAAPRTASISDRFELMGEGFCGDADANHVTIGDLPGLILASSPVSLVLLPPAEMEPGPAQVKLTCGQKSAEPFTIVFVSLELEASSAALAPGERRTLTVHVRGSTAKVNLEARNLSPHVAELVGAGPVRAASNGGPENLAKFELVGKKRGNFMISIRLMTPLSTPKP